MAYHHKPPLTKLVIPVLIFAVQMPVFAGSGTFANGKYAFCASVRFKATPDQLAKIRTAFTNASQVLADATDGQHSFGKIKLVNDSRASDAADYWIYPGSGRAVATHGNYGVRGEHVNMFYASNMNAVNGADGDAYTIAHEHAHHSWGVLDEYSGPGGAAEDAPAGADTIDLNYSLMDNYFLRGGRRFGGGYTLNEFCTAANHDPDHNTWQHKVHGRSVWETIAVHATRPATPPQGLPVSAPPERHTIEFSDISGIQSVMLLLDRSGSMDTDGRIAAAKQAASQYASIFPDGDALGAASFSDAGAVDFPLAQADASTRAAIKTAIGGLSANGSTNIGDGILTALREITSQPERSCNEVIVLLTDGEHNVGTPPQDGIAAAKTEGVTVMTVGLGDQISTAGQSTLQDIAGQTGGKFFGMSQPSDLAAVFMQLSAEVSGQGLLARSGGTAAAGSTAQVPVTVESGTSSVTFTLTQPGSQDSIALGLRSPSGQLLLPESVGMNPGLRYNHGTSWQTLEVTAPEAGQWTMLLTPTQPSKAKYDVIAFARHDGVQLTAIIEKNNLAFPSPAIVQATPRFDGQNVIGAKVTGQVRRADGSNVAIQLFDDGLDEHGDAMPNDGIYNTRFTEYQGDGTYVFELQVKNESGRTYGGETMFEDQPSNEKPVPAFIRLASTTAVVSGVPRTPETPQAPVATVTEGPETFDMDSEEQFLTMYIGLAGAVPAADIDPTSVRIATVNGATVRPIYPIGGSAKLIDIDGDGLPELRIRFDRMAVQNVLVPGSPDVELQGTVRGQAFSASWLPKSVNTGTPPR